MSTKIVHTASDQQSKNSNNRRRKQTAVKEVGFVTKQQVQNMIKAVNPLVELKYVDSNLASYQPTYAMSFISSLVTPTQGSGRSNRIGDVVRYKKLHVRGQYYGAVSHMCRMILFVWEPNTTPTGTDILDGSYVSTFRAPFAPYNYENRKLFQILLDESHVISATGSQNCVFEYNIPLKNVARFALASSTGTQRVYGLWVADGVVTLGTYDIVLRAYFEDE